MHKPAVSIGMPVYNGEAFLGQALQSILAQSFSDFELIVSDNASSDNTEKIVAAFAEGDERVRYIRQPTNIGPIANFNYVLHEAQGDYFMWAAADDVWDEAWINVLIHHMSASVAISFGHVDNIDENGKLLRQYKKFDFSDPKLLRMIKYYFAEDYNGKANIIYGMYHTRALQKHHMQASYKDCFFGVDMLFVFDWLQRGALISDASVLLHKRIVKDASVKRGLSEKVKNSLFMLDRVKYFLVYADVANGFWCRFLFLACFPVKYCKSLMFNSYRNFRKTWASN